MRAIKTYKRISALYPGVLAYICEENGITDPEEAYQALMHEYYAWKKLFGRKPKYKIPQPFCWDEFEKDLSKALPWDL